MGRMSRVLGRRSTGQDEIAALRAEVAALSAELDECRRQHQRVAQLADVVQELLLPAALRDEEKLAQLLVQYTDDLGA
jgi:hypothetical protein